MLPLKGGADAVREVWIFFKARVYIYIYIYIYTARRSSAATWRTTTATRPRSCSRQASTRSRASSTPRCSASCREDAREARPRLALAHLARRLADAPGGAGELRVAVGTRGHAVRLAILKCGLTWELRRVQFVWGLLALRAWRAGSAKPLSDRPQSI